MRTLGWLLVRVRIDLFRLFEGKLLLLFGLLGSVDPLLLFVKNCFLLVLKHRRKVVVCLPLLAKVACDVVFVSELPDHCGDFVVGHRWLQELFWLEAHFLEALLKAIIEEVIVEVAEVFVAVNLHVELLHPLATIRKLS